MMALPDVFVKILSAIAPRTLPTNTAVAFAVGPTTRGPEGAPRRVVSLAEAVQVFGERIAAVPSSYDWIETFFSEGGAELFVQRVFGATAKTASLKLKHTAEEVLTVEAGQLGQADPGLWGNSLFVAVEQPSGTTYKLKVELESGGVKSVVEETPVFTTLAECEAWSRAYSNYVKITVGAGTGIPDVLASKTLSGGTAGTAVADSDYSLALAKLNPELGPGQVSAMGRNTTAVQLALLEHAQQNNRFALLDGTDTPTVATLIAQAVAVYGAPNTARRSGQLLAPWEIIPGLTSSTTRTVAPSARAAAQYAKVDALGNPNQGAAGRRGTAGFVQELTQPNWTATQREELNNAGVTISRRRFGAAIETWGVRSLADQVNDVGWSFAPNVRTMMAFDAKATAIGEDFEFDSVDGFGHVLAQFKGELVAAAMELFVEGALYGGNPSEAFSVNVDGTVNTPKTLSEGKLISQVALRVSPIAEATFVYVLKVPITQTLV